MLGPIAGVIGALQATEVVKEVLDLGDTLAGRLLIYDALAARFEQITVAWDPDNPISGRAATIKDLSIHDASRGSACAAE